MYRLRAATYADDGTRDLLDTFVIDYDHQPTPEEIDPDAEVDHWIEHTDGTLVEGLMHRYRSTLYGEPTEEEYFIDRIPS